MCGAVQECVLLQVLKLVGVFIAPGVVDRFRGTDGRLLAPGSKEGPVGLVNLRIQRGSHVSSPLGSAGCSRSEERRVGKEGRCRGWRAPKKQNSRGKRHRYAKT